MVRNALSDQIRGEKVGHNFFVTPIVFILRKISDAIDFKESDNIKDLTARLIYIKKAQGELIKVLERIVMESPPDDIPSKYCRRIKIPQA